MMLKKDTYHYRVSPIFILPEYQGKRIAQKVFKMIEQLYYDGKTCGFVFYEKLKESIVQNIQNINIFINFIINLHKRCLQTE